MNTADRIALASVRRCDRCGAWVTAPAFRRVPHACDHRDEPASWHDRANCLDVDVEAFFDENNRETTTFVISEVCAPCPVRPVCLATALRHNDVGVWGGTTTEDRKLIARRVRAQARRTA